MSIKPILFSTPMVQAIMAGRKTMTRRVIGARGALYPGETIQQWCERWNMTPRYQIGDVLWVLETFGGNTTGNGVTAPFKTEYWYKADETSQNPDNKWRPSIFMPRDAARLFLRVTAVRAERLQEITNLNAASEGCQPIPCDHPGGYPCTDCMETGFLEPATVAFMELWDDIYAKSGYGLDVNPWVWVYTFERCDAPKVEA